MVPWVGLQSVIVVFFAHNYFLENGDSSYTRLVQKLLRHIHFNMQTLTYVVEICSEVLLSSCKAILLYNVGLTASTFILMLP